MHNPGIRFFKFNGFVKIDIYSIAFCYNPFDRLDDFLSYLVDHEYFHAEELNNNPSMVVPPLWKLPEFITRIILRAVWEVESPDYFRERRRFSLMNEVRAYNHQFEQIGSRDCSPGFIRHLEQKRSDLYEAIENL